MADFNFLPPQTQLFGGQNTAWEPLGQESNLKPYKLGMGEVYGQVSMSPDTDGIRVSITGNRRREDVVDQALNEWGQNNFPAPTNPAGGFGSNPIMQGQQMAQAPNWNNAPGLFVGNERSLSPSDLQQMPIEMQRQIWNAMGMNNQPSIDPFATAHQSAVTRAMGSDSGSVAEATETISRLAKVMKEDLIPATKDYTDQVTRTVGAMGGGGSSGGGIGGFGGGGSGFDTGSGMGGGMPSGEAEMPSFGWSDFISAPNMRMRGLPLFRMRQASSIFIKPMMNEMNDYMSQTAEQDLGMLQSGIINYGDLMQGQYGDIKRRQIAGEEFSYNLGSQVYKAYGGIANAALGGDAGNGILGAAMGIASPAIGMGMIGGAIGGMVGLGGPIGLLAGGATALIGAGGYAYNASQDMMSIGRYQNTVEAQRRSGQYNLNSLFDNFSGVVGDYTEWWRNELGTTSPSESTRYKNAGRMVDLATQYSQGSMSRTDLATQLDGTGYNIGEALTGAQGLFYESAAKRGMDRTQAGQFLSYWQRFNPGTMPSGQQGEDWQALTLSGVNLGDTIGAYANALGISASNQGGMDLANGDVSRYLLNLPQGANRELASQGIIDTANTFARGNAARRRAGLSDLNPLNFQSDLYKQNQGLLNANAAYAEVSGDYALTSPAFYTNVVEPTAEAVGYGQAGRSFDTKQYYRQQNAWAATQDIYNRALDYGNASPTVANAINAYGNLDPDAQRLAMRMATGDRMALSQNWEAMGDLRYRTLNTETGLGIYEQEKRNLQDTSISINRNLDTYQYNMQTSARNIGYQMMTGGSTGVGAQGFANGGDGLAGLSALFAAQGMTLQTGNGMGMWQIEDAGVALSREQQMYRFNQSGASLGIAGANRDLSNRQWQESFAMNQQQFSMQTAYQSQNMSIDREQQMVQNQWQNQDMAMDRNRMELQYGWQQEDYDRNIRFARGRQRVDLMRQQERSTIMHSMDETQQGNEEERAKTTQQWQKEEYDRKKEYFDQSKTLAQQEMDMNKRHHDEKLALDNQSFELTKQNHDKELEWMTRDWALEDQRRLLTRQNAELDYKTATDLAAAAREAQVQLNAVSDILKDIGRTEQNNQGFIDVNTGNGNAFVGGVNAVTPKPTTPAPKPSTPAPRTGSGGGNSGNNYNYYGYAEGGYTGSGPSGGVAGVVHNNEYVVPEGGSLVVRGGGGSEALIPYLARLVALFEKGLINATIYTNANSVKTNSLYNQSLAKVN